MIKHNIKCELIFDSNCNVTEILEKLREQFENFNLCMIEIEQKPYSKYGYPLKYKVVFYHDVWLDLTKFENL
jgi:hypothetical protein